MASTLLSERAKAMATAAGWKLRHIQINHPDGKPRKLVCQDADGRTLMLNGTWSMDPLQAGGWNYAASVGKNKDPFTYSRKSSGPIIVVEEHDNHHISLPPINPLAIVQAPAEDEDVLTRSPLPLCKEST